MKCRGIVRRTGIAHPGDVRPRLRRESIDPWLDSYAPIDSSETRKPVIVTIDGGRFTGADKTHAPHAEHGKYFAARGFVVVLINYRVEHDRPPVGANTLCAALTLLRPSRTLRE
jgi:acetyl esterase/lipase